MFRLGFIGAILLKEYPTPGSFHNLNTLHVKFNTYGYETHFAEMQYMILDLSKFNKRSFTIVIFEITSKNWMVKII